MKDDVVVNVEHVSKKFCRSLKLSMLYGVKDIGRNMLRMGSKGEKLRRNEFWAVDDISFELKKGETIGIIGPNGSGKTTLLKMLNGIFWPDIGKISVRGNTGALIAVGAGFHPMLTGRENIYINGAILGLSKKMINEKMDEIIDFADIGEFIDSPVKFYSSGMFVRLGFSIAVTIEPNVLLIDEILSVGDMTFQNKSLQRLASLREKASVVLFVSHNLNHVRNLCDKVIVMDKGKTVFFGKTVDAIIKYYKLIGERKLHTYEKEKAPFFQHFSSGEIAFLDAGILDENGLKTKKIKDDENIVCYFDFEMKQYKDNLICGVGILDENRLNSIRHYSHDNDVLIKHLSKGKYRLVVKFETPKLTPGLYFSSFVIRDRITGETYERIIGINPFLIEGDVRPLGTVSPKSTWQISSLV